MPAGRQVTTRVGLYVTSPRFPNKHRVTVGLALQSLTQKFTTIKKLKAKHQIYLPQQHLQPAYRLYEYLLL